MFNLRLAVLRDCICYILLNTMKQLLLLGCDSPGNVHVDGVTCTLIREHEFESRSLILPKRRSQMRLSAGHS